LEESRRLNKKHSPKLSLRPPQFSVESLEWRMLLSVSATTPVGPYLTTGAVFNYSVSGTVNGDPDTGTLTYTIAGSSTAPNGATGIEVDETGVLSGTTSSGTESADLNVKGWYLLTSAGGYVEIASESTDAKGTVTDDSFSPPKVGLPATLIGGHANDEDTTDSTTTTFTGGTTTTGTADQADVITLASEIPQSFTVTAGTFSAFMVTDNSTNTPTGGTANVETDTTYWSPQVGLIEIVNVSGSNAQTAQLTSYSIPGDTLQFVAQPVNAPTGQTLPTVSVEFLNSNHVVDTTINGAVTLELIGGDGTLSGTIPVDASSGIATFSGLSVNIGGTYALLASSASANGMALSNPFTITTGTLTWTGGGDGTSWSDPENWDQDQAPVSGNSLVFPTGAPLSPDNDIAGLTINSIDIQGSGYTLTGDDVSLTGGLTSEAGNNTYDIDTTLVGSPTIDDQTGDLSIDSDLSGGGLTLSGDGTFTLDQSNTYSGVTTLDSGVTIDVDTAEPFGTGTLTLDGGVLVNDSGAGLALDNPVSVNGDVTVSTGEGTTGGGAGPSVAFEDPWSMFGPSELSVTGSGPVILESVGSGPGFSGSGPELTVSGSGPVDLANVDTSVLLENGGGESGAGPDEIGGVLGGGGSVTVDGSDTTVQLNSVTTDIEAIFGGDGSINVESGTLQTGSSGVGGYSGTVMLEAGGTIEVSDSADAFGLGTGKLDLEGGVMEGGASGGELDNPVSVGGDVSITSVGQSAGSSVSNANAQVKFLNNLQLFATGDVNIYTKVTLRNMLTGSGAISLDGGELDIATGNPNFTGSVIVNSGTIDVTQNDALGTGALVAELAAQGFLQAVASINDPILDNPLSVRSGTLVLEGQLTFPAGITVDTGATLIVEGSTSQIVSSGALTGGGTIIVESGTFSSPGGSDGFTGSLQFQGGQVTPTLTVTDAGGVANGSPFPATATLSGAGVAPSSNLEGVSPAFTYYTGSTVSGTGTSTAPSAPGTYTVVGSFAGSTDYAAVQSSPVTFTIVAADKLVFLRQPYLGSAGELDRVVVAIENSKGQLMLLDDSTVTLSIASGPGTLRGIVSVKAFHGVAVFDRLFLTTAGSYTLKASDGSDTSAISRIFKITPAAPAKLVFASQPISTAVGDSIAPIVVDVEDQYGNLETGFNSFITLLLDSRAHWGTLRGTTRVRAVDGVATFSNLSIEAAGTYKLEASLGPCISRPSSAFTISPGPSTQNCVMNLPTNAQYGRWQ